LNVLRGRDRTLRRFDDMLFMGIGVVLNAPRKAASNRRSASCLLNCSFGLFAMAPDAG
jgi:hypothetical protein